MILLVATLVATARAFLALLFGQAALSKGRNLRGAAEIVDGYGLLPTSLVRPATLLLVAAEAITAILLLAGTVRPNRAGAAAMLLLLLFAAAMAITLWRGRSVACGCGTNAPISWRYIAATLMLLPAAALAATVLPPPGAPVLAEAAIAGALLFALRRAGDHLRPVLAA